MAKNNELFIRADELEDRGELKAAFRLFLAGAKAGDISCQLNLGNYYDDAKGIRRNRKAALYWYRRAYRRGDALLQITLESCCETKESQNEPFRGLSGP